MPLEYRSAAHDGVLTWVDGHLRSEEAPDFEADVAIVDLEDDDVLKVLLTFDQLAGLAVADNEALSELLPRVQADEEAVREALGQLAACRELVEPGELEGPRLDESIADEVKTVTCPECGGCATYKLQPRDHAASVGRYR